MYLQNVFGFLISCAFLVLLAIIYRFSYWVELYFSAEPLMSTCKYFFIF